MKFKFDEFVWAKLKGYSPWPGKIMFGHSSDPPSKKKEYRYVYFFGTHNHAWVPVDNIYKYVPYRKMFSKKNQTKVFKSAVKYIANEHKGLLELKRDRDSGYPLSESEDESEEEEPRNRRATRHVNRIKRRKIYGNKRSRDFTMFRGVYVLRSEADLLKDVSVKIAKMEPKKSNKSTDSLLSSDSSNSSTSTSSDTSDELVPSSSKMHLSVQGEGSPFSRLSPEISVIPLTDAKLNSFQSQLKLPEVNKMSDIPSKSIEKSMNLHHNLKESAASANIDPKFLPSVSIIPINSLKAKASTIERKPSKRLGFVGLGRVGENIVKTFLSSGHIVSVWSRSQNKYGDAVKAGAFLKNSPAEVVTSSEIIFLCLSKADDLIQIMFSEEGILKAFKNENGSQKILVDLTTVNSKKVAEIQKHIHSFGGLFFEAVVLGSMTGVDCSSLIFLCAGKLNVFGKMRPYLEDITRNVHYFGRELGVAPAENMMTFYAIQGILFSALKKCKRFIKKDRFNLRELKRIIQAMSNNEIISRPLKNVNKHVIAGLTVSKNVNMALPCASNLHDATEQGNCDHLDDDDDDDEDDGIPMEM